MHCPTCGVELPDGSTVCTACGARLDQHAAQGTAGASSLPAVPPAEQPAQGHASAQSHAMSQIPGAPVAPAYTTPVETLPQPQMPRGRMFPAVVTGIIVAAACAAIVAALSLSGAIALRPEQEIRADEDAAIASWQPTLLTGATLTEDQLDDPVASYTYKGETHLISARDVITSASSLKREKRDDGTYTMPTADSALSVARTLILVEEAKSKGITFSDDELSAYARKYAGTDDFDDLARQYDQEVEDIKTQVGDALLISKLRDQVTDGPIGDLPAPPDAPSDGNADTTSADYAHYIIDLAGDEWDAEAGTWRDSNSPYALALAGYEVTNDSASYAAALAAYAVATQNHQRATQAGNKAWKEYVSGLFGTADIHIGSLMT